MKEADECVALSGHKWMCTGRSKFFQVDQNDLAVDKNVHPWTRKLVNLTRLVKSGPVVSGVKDL